MSSCPACQDTGYIETEDCTCGAPSPWGIPGVGHDPMCGTEPCPEGCGDSAAIQDQHREGASA